ncbi:UDP-N-acetylmuramate dehydrogenase [Candidatus Saccharibacteria bacterium]|nr:UDP-N-acetylmuramate dehydrogenase [Candidatus Saccharibacteria bacterium]
MVKPIENVPLSGYSTMRLGGPARYFTDVALPGQLSEAIEWARSNRLPWRVIGGGSNIVFEDAGFQGLIIRNRIRGVSFATDGQDVILQAGAGEHWDDIVRLSCERGLYGIAELSMIPGTVGATPVQNIGAYGREISEVLSSVTVYDSHDSSWKTLLPEDCRFAYRSSIFNSTEKGRYAIASVTYRLSLTPHGAPLYASLASYLSGFEIADHDPFTIRSGVIAIRMTKLPDPGKVANLGSFFKNPIISAVQAEKIMKKHPEMPVYPTADGRIKLAAGWLIEKAHLKGYENHGFCTYKENALVVVNKSSRSSSDLHAFRQEIITRIKAQFGVTLEQEPEIIGGEASAQPDPNA